MEVSTHSLFLLQQLNIQREFGFLCDCTVAIGNVYFKAHRAVLAAFSNYFKMIFIHQSSECIKIQPTDIQPDIFSYLLHIMYTGVGPKQQVDQGRLQEGIKFLHAYQLYRSTGEGAQDTASDTIKMSNLYGIQISSQSANKGGLGQKDGRFCSPDGQRGGSRAEPCPTMSLEEVPSEVQRSNPSVASGEDPNPHGTSSVASGEDPEDISTRIKQERVESELSTEPQAGSPSLADENLSPGLLKDSPRALYCHYCGEHCGSHQGLREHLFSHATGSLPLVECRTQGEEPKSTEEELVSLAERPLQSFMVRRSPSAREQLEARPLEDALRQSQALSDELAAELKGGSSPHSRKRKIACAICSLRFAQRSQLQEHMYTHTGKPSRYLRYNRFCSQLIQASHHFCEGQSECVAEDVAADTQDNGSSCYSLDSEISQESIDAVVVE